MTGFASPKAAPSKSVELKMSAYSLSASGAVLETTTLQIDGALHSTDGNSILAGDITVPESSRLRFPTTNCYTPEGILHGYPEYGDHPCQEVYPEIFLGYGAVFCYGQGTFFADYLLDHENGYMLISVRDQVPAESPCYVVAATDPSVTPQEILNHFEFYLTMYKDSNT